MRNLHLLLILLLACNSPVENVPIENLSKEPSDIFQIDQGKLMEINPQIGSLVKKSTGKEITCNGFIEAGPNSMISVSTLSSGQVKNVHVKLGAMVYKGQILATMQDQQYLNLKQDYFETKSKYEYYREDYKRQGELTIENAASIKNMQQAKRDYEIYDSRLRGLKANLQLIGIIADSLSPEEINALAYVKSPSNGRIIHINVHVGTFCDQNFQMFELINTHHLYAHLQVFEKDAYLIKRSQQVEIQINSMPGDKLLGVISSVNKIIDSESRTMSVHAELSKVPDGLFPGTYLLASIWIEKDSSFVIPETAIVKEQRNFFAFIQLDSNRFQRVPIELGNLQGGSYQVLGPNEIFTNPGVILSGAYYLNGELSDE